MLPCELLLGVYTSPGPGNHACSQSTRHLPQKSGLNCQELVVVYLGYSSGMVDKE